MGAIADGAIVFTPRKKIEWVGPTRDLPKKYLKLKKKSLAQKACVIPGLVDCHTHLVFAGNRSTEFAERCAGATYEQIAARGGGIRTTVNATRAATVEELVKLAMPRVRECVAQGVRTLEIKSGYGLTAESERRTLEAVKKLKAKFREITFQATFLGAHAFPADKGREDYLREILEVMLPEVARKRLADACDVFIDAGYYTREEGHTILAKAKALGLKIKIHADELADTDSAALAVEMGALSADHLLKVNPKGVAALASSNTVAVLLPGTAFYLKAPYGPARALIDAGACVALSTDFNPGTCPTTSLPFVMTLAALYMGMSRAEIFAGVTYNAAKALGFQTKKGSLLPGKDADVVALPHERFEDVYYWLASQPSSSR